MEEELNSDTSDESFIDATVNVVPGSPVSGLPSAMRPILLGEEQWQAEGEKEDLINPEMPKSHQHVADHQEENIEDKKSAEGKATTSIIDDKENSSHDEEYQGESEESESEREDVDELLITFYNHLQKQRHALEHAQNIRTLLQDFHDATFTCIFADGDLGQKGDARYDSCIFDLSCKVSRIRGGLY